VSTKKKTAILNQARHLSRTMSEQGGLTARNIRRLVKKLQPETREANKDLIEGALAKARGVTKGLAFVAGLALAPLSTQAAPVTWDFIATSCAGNGCVAAQTYPVELATLALPGPDSSGSAIWNGTGTTPVYSGSGFSLDWFGRRPPLTDSYSPPVSQQQPPPANGECFFAVFICSFNLSWSESGGQLDAVGLNVTGFSDDLSGNAVGNGPFGLAGGYVASDDTYYGAGDAFAGCAAGQCQIAGYWIDPVTGEVGSVAEPGMLGVMLVGLIGLIGVRRRVNP
jgi:hypothetical protein